MIHVTTTSGSNGLVQVLAPHNTGPTNVITSAYVYVLSGRVGLGTGNGGNTSGHDAVSSTTNTWQLLQAANGRSPANEIVLYSVNGLADFYVGLVSVNSSVQTASVPEPSTLLSSILGVLFSALGFGWWRKRMAESGTPHPSAA